MLYLIHVPKETSHDNQLLDCGEWLIVNWVRIRGCVYSYIEKILERFKGKILTDIEIAGILRAPDAVTVAVKNRMTERFDKIVFATPPDRVLKLLCDPTPAEIKRFTHWKGNCAQTIMHTDRSMYKRYQVQQGSEFDFFQIDRDWGYNAYLNQLCGIQSAVYYSLTFNLQRVIDPSQILHIQDHHTPLYTVEAF